MAQAHISYPVTLFLINYCFLSLLLLLFIKTNTFIHFVPFDHLSHVNAAAGEDIYTPSQIVSFMHNLRVGLKLLPLFHLKSVAGCYCGLFMKSSAPLHGLMLILLLKFRGGRSVCLNLHSITVLHGSLSADQLSLTDAERERRGWERPGQIAANL